MLSPRHCGLCNRNTDTLKGPPGAHVVGTLTVGHNVRNDHAYVVIDSGSDGTLLFALLFRLRPLRLSVLSSS